MIMKQMSLHNTLFIIVFIIFNCLIALLLSYRPVLAASAADDAKTRAAKEENAIKLAPDGINIARYFTPAANPNIPDTENPFFKNYAVIKSSNPLTQNNNILDLANNVNGVGALWGSKKAKNYLDLRYPQTISAWLYFGNDSSDSILNGEGMALVLQNDSQGSSAMGAGGQGLGVDGYDKTKSGGFLSSNSYPSRDYIADSAVKNSLALEFDSQRNDLSMAGNAPTTYTATHGSGFFAPKYNSLSMNAFDTLTKSSEIPKEFPDKITTLGLKPSTFGNISYTFPGDPNSYAQSDNAIAGSPNASKYNSFQKSFTMYHMNRQSTNLIDGQDINHQSAPWHHVVFTWTPPQTGTIGTASYQFNDKNTDGSDFHDYTPGADSSAERASASIPVDESIFHFQDPNNPVVLWGFTASNNEQSLVNSKLVDFESIPSILSAHVTASTTNVNNEPSSSFTADDTVNLNYGLTYDHGKEAWEAINTKIKLPPHFIPSANSKQIIGTITYANNSTEFIYATEIDSKTGLLQHLLGQSLGENNSSAHIQIKGTVDNKSHNTIHIDSQPAKFIGSNEISTTTLPAFDIEPLINWHLKLSTSTPDINIIYSSNTKIDLPTTVQYDDGHNFPNPKGHIRYTVSFNNDSTSTNSVPIDNSATTSFSHDVSLDSIIHKDWETLEPNLSYFDYLKKAFPLNQPQIATVTATDDNGLSDKLAFHITALPDKSLEIDTNSLNFTDINQSNEIRYLFRSSPFTLTVNSHDEPWKLNVTTDGLFHSGNHFNGNLIYRIHSNDPDQILNSTPTTIAQSKTPETGSFDITKNWQQNTGILLKQTHQNEVGDYSGKLSWILSDTLKNT